MERSRPVRHSSPGANASHFQRDCFHEYHACHPDRACRRSFRPSSRRDRASDAWRRRGSRARHARRTELRGNAATGRHLPGAGTGAAGCPRLRSRRHRCRRRRECPRIHDWRAGRGAAVRRDACDRRLCRIRDARRRAHHRDSRCGLRRRCRRHDAAGAGSPRAAARDAGGRTNRRCHRRGRRCRLDADPAGETRRRTLDRGARRLAGQTACGANARRRSRDHLSRWGLGRSIERGDGPASTSSSIRSEERWRTHLSPTSRHTAVS